MKSFKIGNSIFSINSKLQNVTTAIYECEIVGKNISKLKAANVFDLYKILKEFQRRTELAFLRFSLPTKSPDECFGLINLLFLAPDSILDRAFGICIGEDGFKEKYATICEGKIGLSKPFTKSSSVRSSTNFDKVSNIIYGLILFVFFCIVFGCIYYRLIQNIYSDK